MRTCFMIGVVIQLVLVFFVAVDPFRSFLLIVAPFASDTPIAWWSDMRHEPGVQATSYSLSVVNLTLMITAVRAMGVAKSHLNPKVLVGITWFNVLVMVCAIIGDSITKLGAAGQLLVSLVFAIVWIAPVLLFPKVGSPK